MAGFGTEEIGRVLGGRYRLITPLGAGASAQVFLADDVQLRRRVAVKVLHPSLAADDAFLRRFRAEAQAAAALSHPNIMAVFDWGEDGQTPYLVLEYLAGGSLRSMLDRGRLLSPSQALLIGLETARGLDYAHRRGFVHRDIKPANLLFGEDARLRIADFGLARAIAEAAWTEPAGVVLGTARYASPEQAKGLPVDGKTDVYSLALTLIESVTGQVPFATDTTVATLMNRLDKLMPVSAELGPLAPVLERAGRPHPEERYEAGEFGRALVQAAERLPRPAPLPLVAATPTGWGEETVVKPPGPTPTTATATAAATTERPAGNGQGRAPVPVATRTGVIGAVGVAGAGAGSGAMGPGGDTLIGARPPSSSPPRTPFPSPETLDDEPPRRHHRTKWIVIAVAVLLLAAAVAGGAVAIANSRTRTFAVPNLIGLPAAQAQNLIAEYDWKVDLRQQRDDSQPFGAVFEQTPHDGRLDEGEAFVLFISQGAKLRALPELTGKPVAEAQATLDALALPMKVAGTPYDEVVPKDTVVSWSVGGQPTQPGQEVEKGTQVDVLVSAGPEPRTIPPNVNVPFEQVSGELGGGGLLVVRDPVDQFSDTVAAGNVIATSPPQGTQVERGTTVTVVVSKGTDLRTVPDLTGQTLDQATATLAAEQLVVGDLAPRDPAGRTVIQTSPLAGKQLRPGSPVSLLFG